jgi:hypothetical protein
MQRKQTALGLFWSIVIEPQRKQRVYPYLRRGDRFSLSQNNEILLDGRHTPPGLFPSDEFLPPSLLKNSDISHILEKVLICIFWQICSML